jgi:Holliday junction resolvasome RuvABC endonuclease subunit
VIVLGIDPGLNGGLALLGPDGLLVEAMPVFKIDGKGHLDLQTIRSLIAEWSPDHVFMERQQSMPKQGLSSTFKTGFGYGVLHGLCAGMQLPVTEVSPGTWKRALGCPADKDGARARASQVFPSHASSWARKKDDGVAESALVAEYGRRVLSNQNLND